MRFKIIFVLLLSPLTAWSAPKQVADFFALSKKYRTEKPAALQALEKEFQSTQKEYEARDPKGGGEQEKKVLFFAITMEPLFKTKTFNKTTCKKAEHQVIYEDKMGRLESEPLTPEAQEALAWLKVLCK
jgi:hypothetical protein